jgi:uncharacterized protein
MNILRSLNPDFRSGSQDDEFLVSIVDEAHALINPEHIEGRGQFGFTTALGPQAYHIIRSSTVTVFLLDRAQGFRDRENTTVEDLKSWAKHLKVEVFEEISLKGNQYRCAGSREYMDWVDSYLGFATEDESRVVKIPAVSTKSESPRKQFALAAEDLSPYKEVATKNNFSPFEVKLFDNLCDLEDALRQKISEGHTARFLASYAREWKTDGVAIPHNIPPHLMDFHEPYEKDGTKRYWSKIWNYVPNGNDYSHFIQAAPGSKIAADPLCEVGCPYAVRGFDFDFVGLLWLSDLKWRNGKWTVDLHHVFERGISRRLSAARNEIDENGQAHVALLEAVQAAYRIVLTRAMKGLYLWCEDGETKEYLSGNFMADNCYPNELRKHSHISTTSL